MNDLLFQDGVTRRLDSDSDLCIDDENRLNVGMGEASNVRRNSASRVSIRLVSDDRSSFLASYKNRD